MCIYRIITLEWSLTEEAKRTRELFRLSTTARGLGGTRLIEKDLKRPKIDVLVSCKAVTIFINQKEQFLHSLDFEKCFCYSDFCFDPSHFSCICLRCILIEPLNTAGSMNSTRVSVVTHVQSFAFSLRLDRLV